MAGYVDGFVLPVPTKNMAAYRKMARLGCKIMRELGALAYVEAVADDVKPGKSDLVSAEREAQARRDGRFLVHRLQVAQGP